MTSISLNNISITYESTNIKKGGMRLNRLMNLKQTKNSIYVIKDLSLNLDKGDVLALKGSSGSGKTTLMRVILGNLFASSGSVEVSGSVSIMIEGNVIEHKSTGIQNILMNGYRSGLSGKRLNTYKNNIINKFKNAELLTQPYYLLPREIKIILGEYIHIENMGNPDICLVDNETIPDNALMVEEITKQCDITILATNNQAIIDKFCNKELNLDDYSPLMSDSVKT